MEPQKVRLLRHPPLLYEIAQFMIRHHVRGGPMLTSIVRSCWGLADSAATYRLKNGNTIHFPLAPPYGWDRFAILNYEKELVDVLHDKLKTLSGPVTLVDCGADVGLVVASLVDRARQIDRVFALEPNPTAFALLQTNVALLPVDARALNVAASDYVGRASLRTPDHDRSTHAAFIVADPAGDIQVLMVDQLGIRGGNLVMKVDVEGAELNVIRGASETLRSAKAAIVAIEAHPIVAKRTCIDPVEVMRALNSIRRFSFCIAEESGAPIDLEHSFFSQVDTRGDARVFNIVGASS